MNSRRFRMLAGVVIVFALFAVPAFAENLKPLTLASEGVGDVPTRVSQVRQALSQAGFEIVGEYSPYADAHVLVVTNKLLKNNAAQSDFGAYGAIQRVSVTKVGGNIQVAHTTPQYMANAYRMKDDLGVVAEELKTALGFREFFGSEKGVDAGKLRKYHYKFAMPYFDDPDKLAKHASYEEAITKVEAGLAAKKGGTQKIFRVDIPGKKESVFGVAMDFDQEIMESIDKGPMKHTAHLCYELVVSADTVYALNAKFRIAINFPDLTMGGFAGIMSAPGRIEDALEEASE